MVGQRNDSEYFHYNDVFFLPSTEKHLLSPYYVNSLGLGAEYWDELDQGVKGTSPSRGF